MILLADIRICTASHHRRSLDRRLAHSEQCHGRSCINPWINQATLLTIYQLASSILARRSWAQARLGSSQLDTITWKPQVLSGQTFRTDIRRNLYSPDQKIYKIFQKIACPAKRLYLAPGSNMICLCPKVNPIKYAQGKRKSFTKDSFKRRPVERAWHAIQDLQSATSVSRKSEYPLSHMKVPTNPIP